MKLIKLILLSLLLVQAGLVSANEGFPHRSLYPKVKPIELEELYNRREEVVIFDVRSAYEYNTLHIKGAQHLALNDHEFISTLQKLRKSDERPLVFYCNGHTCKKSYKAAQKAMKWRIRNVYAYDAGIFEWTKAHPGDAVLLGNTPVDPSLLLTKEKLNSHMLEPEAFGKRVGKGAITLDIRETMQKDGLSLFPTRQRSVPLDNEKLKSYVDEAKTKGKTLLIYDAVGKQVRWLQYYLEKEGISDYYFMKGGAKAFLNY
jgi:rhodanese-related sulfurtransferase